MSEQQLEKVRAALAGRYEVERLLGQGGMALVYLARDARHDRTVAIKVLRSELALMLGSERFLREIHVASTLQHPHILSVYDSGEADGVLYFVMPFISGESLRHRLDREHQLGLADAVALTCEIADALHYAHAHGVVHRDIKPENILLEEGHAIIADFGIARAASSENQKLTETGMSVGTPTYMSPEQGTGGDRVDGRSDQYSLACVLYEMLAGQPPFAGSNPMAILAKHSMETVPSLQVVRQSIPDEIEDAIMRALEKTPADRYPTMHDFATALAEVDLGPGARRSNPRVTATRRRTTPRGMPVRPARSRRSMIAAGIGAAALLAFGGWAAWQTWGASDAAGRAPPGPDPRRIAVMYFDTRESGDSLRFLADGLTEALINELSEVQPLSVISRNGVAGFRGAAPDSVARALDVGTLVTGRVARSADQLRVTVELVDASGRQISSETIERPRSDLFALQDSVAAEVARFLRLRLGEEIELRESRAGTRVLAAWEASQHARDELAGVDALIAAGDEGAVTRAFDRVDSLFASAAALDSRWAAPATQRGWLTFRRARLTGEKAEQTRLLDAGLQHAERALSLDPADADALELRGTLRYWRWLTGLEPDRARADKLLADAEADFQASVAAHPQQASAWTSLSHLLINKPSLAEANLAALRAYEADPYLTNANVTLWRLFSTSLDLEEGDAARRWCGEGMQRFPADPRFVECQILLFALSGAKPDVPRVWTLLDRYIELSPPNLRDYRRSSGQMQVAIALARAGLEDSARAVIGRARAPDAEFDPTRELAYLEALAQTILGDHDAAFSQLSRFVASNPAQRQSLAADRTWWFKDLRDDPRYRTLVGS